MRVKSIAVFLAGALLVGEAAAQTLTCDMSTEGAFGEVSARVEFDTRTGLSILQQGFWRPPAEEPQASELTLQYRPDDQAGFVLEAAAAAVVLEFSQMTAPAADVVLAPSLGLPLRRPWRMYEQARNAPPTPTLTESPVGFVGLIPFSEEDGLSRLADADSVEVSVVGSNGEVLTSTEFSLSAKADATLELQRLARRVAVATHTPPQGC